MSKPSLSLRVFDPRLAKQLQNLMDVFRGVYEHVCMCMCVPACVCMCVLECVGEAERLREEREGECILKAHNTPGQCHSLCKPNSFSEDWGCIRGPIIS